jgi:hypothetical protein
MENKDMSIIDFRIRPPFPGYAENFKPGMDRFADGLNLHVADSFLNPSIEALVKEMDAAGIDKAVVPARPAFAVTNEQVLTLAEEYPGRFIPFVYLDHTNQEKALADLEKYVLKGKARGVILEPGLFDSYTFDSPELEPIYRKLEEEQVLTMITFSGLVGKYVDNSMPGRIDRVAAEHPELKIILAHGGWPWTKEVIVSAFRRPNLYVSPDFYSTNCPGWDDYREAANHLLKNQMLFASSYPIGTLEDAVANVKRWKLDPASEEKYLYGNAAKLLNL